MTNDQISSFDFFSLQENNNSRFSNRSSSLNCSDNRSGFSRSNGSSCCCRNSLRESIELLTNDVIRNFIDLDSFTLIGENWASTVGQTTIRSFSECNDQTIIFSDSSGFTRTTVCDLIGLSFNLINPCSTELCETRLTDRFSSLIQRAIPRIDGRKNCCAVEASCCCNKSKASFLANSISPVNILVNTNSLMSNALCNLSVITVSDNLAWFIDLNNRTVYIFCLNEIVAMG